MSRIFGSLLSVGLAFLLGAAKAGPAPDDAVTKDSKGRVISRTTTNPDQSRHRTSFEYGSDSARPLVIVDEDLDRFDQATKRVEQRFDGEGRLREKLDLRIDAAGKRTGTRTRYDYDPSGRRFDQVTPVN
jgi:hypothetical protein